MEVFFNLQSCNFIQKRLQHKCFPIKILKFIRAPILKNICERLLLKVSYLWKSPVKPSKEVDLLETSLK